MAQTLTTPSPNGVGSDGPRIGSFEIGRRLVEIQERLAAGAAIEVAGVVDSRFSSLRGTAYCVTLPPADPTLPQRVSALLSRRSTLRHPNLLPALETGIAGNVAFVIEPESAGASLSATLHRSGALSPAVIGPYIRQVAVALSAAHQAGLSHGQLHPGAVWVDPDGTRVRLGALGVVGRGPRRDLALLAALAFELLSGQRWRGGSTDATALPADAPPVDRVRDGLPGLTERIAIVIANGLAAEVARDAATPEAFAAALEREIEASAADLLGGAFDAVGSGNPAMATLLADAAAKYAPASDDLALVRHRISGDTRAQPVTLPTEWKPFDFAPLPAVDNPTSSTPPEVIVERPSIADGSLDPEIIALLAGPVEQIAPPRGNPWVWFAAGAFGLLIVLTVLVAISMNAS